LVGSFDNKFPTKIVHSISLHTVSIDLKFVALCTYNEVVGTHVVLACKWIITVFTYNTAPLPLPLPPPQSMLLKPKRIMPDEKWDTTLNRGRRDCHLLNFKCFVAFVPRLLKLIESLSEVVGTHVVLAC
jgi:hypothetical protein